MANCANISERDRLEQLWNQQKKYFSFSDNLFTGVRRGFYWLVTGLTAEERIKVWSCSDRVGNIYWNAYDPVFDHILERATESELRLWLEKRYNR